MVTVRARTAAASLVLVLLAGCTDGKGSSSGGASNGQPTTTAALRVTGGPFCEFAITFRNRFTRVNPAGGGGEDVRATFEEAAKAIEDAERLAPEEIKSDVNLLAVAYRDLLGILREANFDFTRIPPTAAQAFQNPELQAANQRLDAYTRQNCRVGG